ncbi:MAG: hypothetical protein HOW97_10150 [Catenulispora sp.]|nr:hypothetical protein [Catenulispora sp.]
MDLEAAGAGVKYLIRDRDAKFPPLFDEILAQAGIQVVLSGIRVPRKPHLLHALREYKTHYNRFRAHQAIEQATPLRAVPAPITDPHRITNLDIRRHDRLDGIIHEHQHAA